MHLGILTFLRRSPKTFPPLAGPAPTAPVPQRSIQPEVATVPFPRLEVAVLEARPQPFHSERYRYDLTLPPAWQAGEPRSIAGSPPIDRFNGPGGISFGVWTEPCPLRALPEVPPAERAATLSLADGRDVPFIAFAPSGEGGVQFLEGRWLARGERWTVDVQVPSGSERTPKLEALGDILATLAIDG